MLQWASFSIKEALCTIACEVAVGEVGQSAVDILRFSLLSHSVTAETRLTAVWLATDPRSGDFPAVLVDAPTLAPVALLLPVVAVLIAARDESPLHLHTKNTQRRVRCEPYKGRL